MRLGCLRLLLLEEGHRVEVDLRHLHHLLREDHRLHLLLDDLDSAEGEREHCLLVLELGCLLLERASYHLWKYHECWLRGLYGFESWTWSVRSDCRASCPR